MEEKEEEHCREDDVTEPPQRKLRKQQVFIPDEIIFNILMKIPSKYIRKLRCVCKTWETIVSSFLFTDSFLDSIENNSPCFAILHRNRNAQVHLSTYHHGNHQKQLLFKRTNDSGKDFYNLLPTSVSGLICIIGVNCFHICNPTTQQIRTFSIKKLGTWSPDQRRFGFGFDMLERVCKIVQVHYKYENGGGRYNYSIQCAVLTLDGSSSWRTIKPPEYAPNSDSVFVGGVIYWKMASSTSRILPNQVIILTFNVCDETFNTMATPQSLVDECLDNICLVEMQGRLFLVRNNYNEGAVGKMELWVLKNCTTHEWYGGCKLVFDYGFNINIEPRYIIGMGKVIFQKESSGLVFYDEDKQLVETVFSEHNHPRYQTSVYYPSLVSLDM